MTWEGKHVLVTGAGGFIGSHLVEALVRQGAQVTAFVRYNSRNDPGLLRFVDPIVLGGIKLCFGDLRDFQAVRGAMDGVHTVFHLGALIGIPYSYVYPSDVAQTNVLGTLNVLMAAREMQVERIVHTSTSEVYGTARYVPMDEAHPLQAQSPYAASKIGADKLAESFYRSYALPVVTVRPFNTYGPRQSARAVIPTMIVQMLMKTTVRLGSVHPRRDFNFVSDTVAGFLAAATCDGVVGEVINIGSGREISIGDLVSLIRTIVGRPVTIEVGPERVRSATSEVERLLADNRKARALLGWSPQISLEEGLRRTIDWVAAHQDLYQAERYAI